MLSDAGPMQDVHLILQSLYTASFPTSARDLFHLFRSYPACLPYTAALHLHTTRPTSFYLIQLPRRSNLAKSVSLHRGTTHSKTHLCPCPLAPHRQTHSMPPSPI